MGLRKRKKKNKESIVLDEETCLIPYLPREVLVNIFQFYVKSEGIVRLLNNVSGVSKPWKDAIMDSKLWSVIDDPELSRYMLLELKNNLSFTVELNVIHLRKSLTCRDLLSVIPFCPKLKRIKFQTVDELSLELVKKLPKCCPALEEVTFRSGQLIIRSVSPLLTVCGPNLKYIDLSKNTFVKFPAMMTDIAKSCPLLGELHLEQISGANLDFPFLDFQIHCPKLRVLDLDEVRLSHVIEDGPGFPELETFICRVIWLVGPDDTVLTSILHASTKLKTLCLPGNTAITYDSLSKLDISLETLDLPRCQIVNQSLHLVISKWKFSLKYLDLSMITDEYALNETIWNLIEGSYNASPLIKLNLSSSPILYFMLKHLLFMCRKLTYLNLEYCPTLGRDIKGTYRTYEEILHLRRKLAIVYCA